MHRLVVCCLTLLLAVPTVAAQTDTTTAPRTTLYVSPQGDDQADGHSPSTPLATIEAARDKIRALRAEAPLPGPVNVYLMDGVHRRTKPLVLTEQDTGTRQTPIVYAGQPGARAIIDGGRTISGWKNVGPDRWSVTLPEVKNGDWDFIFLYMDGEALRRARIPNEGFFRVAGFPDGGRDVHYHTDCKRFEYKPGDIDPSWTNLQDVEVIVYHFWTDSHLPIDSIDTENHIVTFQHKAGKVFTDDFTDDGARYIVENVLEGLDAPGEWYLNRQTGELLLQMSPGVDPNDHQIVAPVAPALLEIRGKPVQRKPVEWVELQNIEFRHTNWQLPQGNSNDRQGSSSVPASISLEGAHYVALRNCTFRNLGTSAIDLQDGCQGNVITANRLEHIAACGIRLDGGTADDHPLLRTADNTVSDNLIAHYGDYYPSAVGVLLQHTEDNAVVHNDIGPGWYTAVSVGWTWGYQRSIARDNVIAFNHIHDIGQGLLSDMGGIYTLGVSPGTELRQNLIHDVEANHYGGWGIYNDEGSSHILIENNVVYNTKFAGYNIHFAKEITVRNNIFALGRLEQLSRSRVEPHESVFFENNIVYWKDGALLAKNWTDKPYTFHFHPKNKEGTRERTSTFQMDWNLYFNPTKPRDEVSFAGMTWEEWHATGKDRHSLYADPLFVDPENHDFRLRPESPAWELGFQPINLSAVGPRTRPGPRGIRPPR